MDLWDVMDGQLGGTSSGTDLKRIPDLHRKVSFRVGTTNVDIGGGSRDMASRALYLRGVRCFVYDPYNRSMAHNMIASDAVRDGQSDTATVSDVLNVIRGGWARDRVIAQSANAVGVDGAAYFTVCVGDGTGIGRATSDGWQENRGLLTYVAEIEKHFRHALVYGDIIVAKQVLPLDMHGGLGDQFS